MLPPHYTTMVSKQSPSAVKLRQKIASGDRTEK